MERYDEDIEYLKLVSEMPSSFERELSGISMRRLNLDDPLRYYNTHTTITNVDYGVIDPVFIANRLFDTTFRAMYDDRISSIEFLDYSHENHNIRTYRIRFNRLKRSFSRCYKDREAIVDCYFKYISPNEVILLYQTNENHEKAYPHMNDVVRVVYHRPSGVIIRKYGAKCIATFIETINPGGSLSHKALKKIELTDWINDQIKLRDAICDMYQSQVVSTTYSMKIFLSSQSASAIGSPSFSTKEEITTRKRSRLQEAQAAAAA